MKRFVLAMLPIVCLFVTMASVNAPASAASQRQTDAQLGNLNK